MTDYTNRNWYLQLDYEPTGEGLRAGWVLNGVYLDVDGDPAPDYHDLASADWDLLQTTLAGVDALEVWANETDRPARVSALSLLADLLAVDPARLAIRDLDSDEYAGDHTCRIYRLVHR